ncbi:MAG: redox-regulated ATPase YchF [Patescibacteria group bacterium]
MKIGIVGLPNVGKSTLFKALTKTQVDINNYPFCTIEPNVGIVKVPDERLSKLAEMSKSKKVIPTVIEFVDIAGLVKGASTGEGLGNKFLANIREVDAIAQVVRVFSAQGGPASGWENITHVYQTINPERDIEIINTELILADLETIQKVIQRLEKDAKRQDKGAEKKLSVAKEIQKNLADGKLANETELDLKDEETKELIQEIQLLTLKPFLYVYNVSNIDEKLSESLESKSHTKLDIKIEEELIEMSKEEAEELGISSNLDTLILKAYEILGLITFLTTGEDETRAWTIKKGWTAPLAGTAIHTDFKDKFIRAEVINWQKLLEAGSWSKARELGTLRTEGKEYVVQDGDVIEFKI